MDAEDAIGHPSPPRLLLARERVAVARQVTNALGEHDRVLDRRAAGESRSDADLGLLDLDEPLAVPDPHSGAARNVQRCSISGSTSFPRRAYLRAAGHRTTSRMQPRETSRPSSRESDTLPAGGRLAKVRVEDITAVRAEAGPRLRAMGRLVTGHRGQRRCRGLGSRRHTVEPVHRTATPRSRRCPGGARPAAVSARRPWLPRGTEYPPPRGCYRRLTMLLLVSATRHVPVTLPSSGLVTGRVLRGSLPSTAGATCGAPVRGSACGALSRVIERGLEAKLGVGSRSHR